MNEEVLRWGLFTGGVIVLVFIFEPLMPLFAGMGLMTVINIAMDNLGFASLQSSEKKEAK